MLFWYVAVCLLLPQDGTGQVIGAQCRDLVTGKKFEVHAKVVINATGEHLCAQGGGGRMGRGLCARDGGGGGGAGRGAVCSRGVCVCVCVFFWGGGQQAKWSA
jgi:hypothetical protein